jgi:hypothetical protein
MKKLKLNIATRLILLVNLPEQGSVVDMISKRNVRRKIDFSSEEMESAKINITEDKVTWDPNAVPIEVEFTESEVNFLKDIIDKLDKAGNITDNILDFCEQILEK